MSLIEVMHQSGAQQMLQRALAADRVTHAYIFHGPDGVGKETLARGFAERLLCDDPREVSVDGEASDAVGLTRAGIGCGECESCRAVAAGSHPDLHLIHRHLNREHPDPQIRKRKGLDISIDVIRHFVIGRVLLTPALGRAKVFIVKEADKMTTQAQNALLKTLEEPPDKTFMILLVRSVDRLLPTTLSRCQLVRFGVLPTGFVEAKLAERVEGIPPEQITWYAHYGDGSLGRALEMIDENLHETNERILAGLSKFPADRSGAASGAWIEQAKALSATYRKRDPEISETEATRRALKTILHLAAGWYADLLRVQTGHTAGVVNRSERVALEKAVGRVGPDSPAAAVQCVAEAERRLDLNVNTQLVLDSFFIDLARLMTPSGKGARVASGR